jgi:hypothetical protein
MGSERLQLILNQRLIQLMFSTIAVVAVAVIAAVLAYFLYDLTKSYFDTQQRLRQVELQHQRQQQTLHLRLQAYERLLLLCERISLPNLATRLRTEGASANDLRFAMLIGIKQEFEHNITQQLYISESLWKIIQAARDNAADIVNVVAQKMDGNADAGAFIAELLQFLAKNGDAIGTAQAAIKQEAAILL